MIPTLPNTRNLRLMNFPGSSISNRTGTGKTFYPIIKNVTEKISSRCSAERNAIYRRTVPVRYAMLRFFIFPGMMEKENLRSDAKSARPIFLLPRTTVSPKLPSYAVPIVLVSLFRKRTVSTSLYINVSMTNALTICIT